MRVDKENLEVYMTCQAQYSGVCILNEGHKFKRNKIIGKVRNATNPMVLYSGWVCHRCVAELPRGKPV